MKLPDRIRQAWGVVLMPRPERWAHDDPPLLLAWPWFSDNLALRYQGWNTATWARRCDARAAVKHYQATHTYNVGRMRVVRLTITVRAR